jgi:hypothetical protein
MQDPMANLTGDAPVGGQDPAGGASMGMANGKQVFDPIALQINMQRIERIRAVMGIASGCVAGIIGLTGLEGLGKDIVCTAECETFFIKSSKARPCQVSHTISSLYRYSLLLESAFVCCYRCLGLENGL